MPPEASGNGFDRDGALAAPTFPPPSSSWVLRVASGGYFCYYDTETGERSWFAPEGSSSSFVYDQADFSQSVSMCDLPPPLPANASICAPFNTGWFAHNVDANDCVLLYHGRTGHVRLAPWICLRDEYGRVYFGNLITRVTQWYPPKLWMQENIARPPLHDIDMSCQRVDDLRSIALCLASAHAPPSKLTRLVNRTMVEGGAPYRNCIGLPHYPPDSFDNDLTFPINGHYERINGTLWKKM
ncbi:hypothetical protein EMIHUDRAFT_101506 [Emiliania huxleyi CCMP1516]|uniref:WW domain-containing protein n=2 Tax=Emiliania huxleyi TaxID=2903 RepID=A0A0D3JDS6_EMIH1|nr:hypothetical protein EMIHUDRAFT_101506 [Emiliania huxleyi CCMP1516]EOD21661.1 hypothetical protein EMIHUDRAFT_101506 [Emiliania huxleyi CCMP1516]|eukprot:XP_005774090.1 hypothetical protein EMIHUDRAFT_101506 [Emiliania huxleyi CCMP1516]